MTTPAAPFPSAPTWAAPDPQADGWRAVSHLVAWVINLFGDAAWFAGLVWLRPALRRAALIWLRPAEALARRLLLARAAAMPVENAPAGLSRSVGRAPGAGGRGGFAGDPSGWPVAFRMKPLAQRARPLWPKPARARPPRLVSGFAIAERIEALTRVCADPDAFARRIARRLRVTPLGRARLETAEAPSPDLVRAALAVVSPAARARMRRDSG